MKFNNIIIYVCVATKNLQQGEKVVKKKKRKNRSPIATNTKAMSLNYLFLHMMEVEKRTEENKMTLKVLVILSMTL